LPLGALFYWWLDCWRTEMSILFYALLPVLSCTLLFVGVVFLITFIIKRFVGIK
jgi:hypothetical protein